MPVNPAEIQSVRYDMPQPSGADNFLNLLNAGATGYFNRQQQSESMKQEQLARLIPVLAQMGQLSPADPNDPNAVSFSGQNFSMTTPRASSKDALNQARVQEIEEKLAGNPRLQRFLGQIMKSDAYTMLAMNDPDAANEFAFNSAMSLENAFQESLGQNQNVNSENPEIIDIINNTPPGQIPVLNKKTQELGYIMKEEYNDKIYAPISQASAPATPTNIFKKKNLPTQSTPVKGKGKINFAKSAGKVIGPLVGQTISEVGKLPSRAAGVAATVGNVGTDFLSGATGVDFKKIPSYITDLLFQGDLFKINPDINYMDTLQKSVPWRGR